MIKLNYIKIIQYTIHNTRQIILFLLFLFLLLYMTNYTQYTQYTQYTLPVTNLLAVALVGVFSDFLVLIIWQRFDRTCLLILQSDFFFGLLIVQYAGA